LASKILDMIELIANETDFEEIQPENMEHLRMLIQNRARMEFIRRHASISLESMFPTLDGAELDRIRAILFLILTRGFGFDRDYTCSLLFADGHEINWH